MQYSKLISSRLKENEVTYSIYLHSTFSVCGGWKDMNMNMKDSDFGKKGWEELVTNNKQ